MEKHLSIGETAPDFTSATAYDQTLQLSKALTAKHTVLLFSRYYGCSLCQLDIHDLSAHYDLITAQGAKAMVVLQSDPETLREENPENPFPFTIICDPKCQIYKDWGIAPAKSKAELASPGTIAKIAKAKVAGYSHGKYEGEELQLPALFILAPDMRIEYAKYAKNLADLPDAAGIAKLLADMPN